MLALLRIWRIGFFAVDPIVNLIANSTVIFDVGGTYAFRIMPRIYAHIVKMQCGKGLRDQSYIIT